MNNNKNILNTINLLKLAFEANLKAHYYSNESQEYFYCNLHLKAREFSDKKSFEYILKEKLLLKAIRNIKKYKINQIKYWIWFDNGTKVVYFCHNNKQLSFHYFWKTKIKKYSWQWSGIKNLENFPF